MNIKIDTSEFDDRQMLFAKWLIKTIKYSLNESDIDNETKNELTENLAFQIAVLIDGDVIMPEEDKNMAPFLCFSEEDESIIASEGGSWMHEYIHGLLDEDEEEDSGSEAHSEEIDDEESDAATDPDSDEIFELAVKFGSGLMLGLGCFEIGEEEEFASEVAMNLHFVTTHTINHSSPKDVVIKDLCKAFDEIIGVSVKVDDKEWRFIKEDGLSALTIDEFCKAIGTLIIKELES